MGKVSRYVFPALLAGLAMLLSACASSQAINFNIHTDPEGSHLVYKVSEGDGQGPGQWIYLGVTPYKGVTLFDGDALDRDHTISLKVMHNGYLDQVKEWNGRQFTDQFEKEEMIFWAPHLVRSSQ